MQEMNQNQMPGTTGNKGQTELASSFQGRERETEKEREEKRFWNHSEESWKMWMEQKSLKLCMGRWQTSLRPQGLDSVVKY